MKYALVDGEREEARPGLPGVCPACNNPMDAKCGNIRMHHWAHHAESHCDPWWEKETEWHRIWKDRFPANWQEVVHSAPNGEKHIADVKTDQGWVLEFQHSAIARDERKARETFYQKLVWIVDGARRKRDKSQFNKALNAGRLIVRDLNLWGITFPDEYALLRDWVGSSAPVFFDFSGGEVPEDTQLWCLLKVVNGMAYCGPLSREHFIKYHSPEANGMVSGFQELLTKLHEIIEIVTQRRQVGLPDPRATLLRQRERRYQERLRSKRPHF